MFNLIGSALDGLVYLHKQKIIHMNIRASNLLIVEKPNNLPCLKISDFALAQREPFRVRSRGPVQWLSPEMIRGHFAASCYSSGCDIWSFGITLLG